MTDQQQWTEPQNSHPQSLRPGTDEKGVAVSALTEDRICKQQHNEGKKKMMMTDHCCCKREENDEKGEEEQEEDEHCNRRCASAANGSTDWIIGLQGNVCVCVCV